MPIFCLGTKKLGVVDQNLHEMIARSVNGLGYEFVGMELKGAGSASMLVRVYIDHAQGISLDDCAKVSHQVSGLLDVEDPIAGPYQLEISSPGLDRPLFVPEHYKKYIGSRVKLKLHGKVDGHRTLRGLLHAADEEQVSVEWEPGQVLTLSYGNIASGRLDPDL